MGFDKKGIYLSFDEVRSILNCIDISSVYLLNCKSRFKLLNLNFYCKEIDKGIDDCLFLRNKFANLYDKFERSIYFENSDNIFDTFCKFLE